MRQRSTGGFRWWPRSGGSLAAGQGRGRQRTGRRIHGNALQAASRGGHEAVVRLLLDKGADVNAQGGELRQRSASGFLWWP